MLRGILRVEINKVVNFDFFNNIKFLIRITIRKILWSVKIFNMRKFSIIGSFTKSNASYRLLYLEIADLVWFSPILVPNSSLDAKSAARMISKVKNINSRKLT